MVIEINKNIDSYKESVALGLTAKQLLYSALSIAVGGGIVLLSYQYVGLTASAYIAIPLVAPIAMTGFYSYHGMTFMEVMKLKLYFAFANRTYTYVSAEGEQMMRQQRKEGTNNKAGKKRSKGRKVGNSNENLAAARKKTVHMIILAVLFLLAFMGLAVWHKYR